MKEYNLGWGCYVTVPDAAPHATLTITVRREEQEAQLRLRVENNTDHPQVGHLLVEYPDGVAVLLP
jgi:hypothetical protein